MSSSSPLSPSSSSSSSVIIDDSNSNSNKKPAIVRCVICKTILEQQKDQYLYKCPKCKLEYTLYYEVMAYDDSVGTVYDEDAATIELEGLEAAHPGGALVSASSEYEDIYEDDEDEDNKTKSDIPIPKYMKDSETTKVIEYREE